MPLDRQALAASLHALQVAAARDGDDCPPLAERLAEILAAARGVLAVDGVGLMLLDEGDVLHVVGVSDRASAFLEEAQQETGAGPGVDCVRDGGVVAVEDLAGDATYPRLWAYLTTVDRAAAASPLRAVLCVPVKVAGGIVGTLNVMASAPKRWTPERTEAVQAYAAVISVLLRLGATAQRRSTAYLDLIGGE